MPGLPATPRAAPQTDRPPCSSWTCLPRRFIDLHGEDRRHWCQLPRQAGRAGQGGRRRHRQAEQGTGRPLTPQPAQPEAAQGWGKHHWHRERLCWHPGKGDATPRGVARTQISRAQPGHSAQPTHGTLSTTNPAQCQLGPRHTGRHLLHPPSAPFLKPRVPLLSTPVLPLAASLSPQQAAGAPMPGRAGGGRRCRCPAGRLAR